MLVIGSDEDLKAQAVGLRRKGYFGLMFLGLSPANQFRLQRAEKDALSMVPASA